jgi:hypothetical protein
MTGHQQRPPDFRSYSDAAVIPGRGPIARSRASYDALCREPGARSKSALADLDIKVPISGKPEIGAVPE